MGVKGLIDDVRITVIYFALVNFSDPISSLAAMGPKNVWGNFSHPNYLFIATAWLSVIGLIMKALKLSL